MFNIYILLECCLCWTYTLSHTVNTHNDTYTPLSQTHSLTYTIITNTVSLSPSLSYKLHTLMHTHPHVSTWCPPCHTQTLSLTHTITTVSMFIRLNQKTNPQSVWLHNEGANIGEDVQDDIRRPNPPAGGRVWRLCWRWGLALCHTVFHLPIQVGGQVVKAKVLPAQGVIHKRCSQRWDAGTSTLLLFFVVVF